MKWIDGDTLSYHLGLLHDIRSCFSAQDRCYYYFHCGTLRNHAQPFSCLALPILSKKKSPQLKMDPMSFNTVNTS